MARTITLARPSGGIRVRPIPTAALGAAGGLILIALAGNASRMEHPAASLVWGLGVASIVVVGAIAALQPSTSDVQRACTLVLIGLALYAAKWLASPTALILPDEFSHLRAVADMLRTGHPFAENPLLPVAAGYPGLAAATAALMHLSGGDAFPAAVVLIGFSRALHVVALFAIFRLVGSSRVAVVATLLYAANPSFLQFQAQYAYESLAVPLATFAVCCILGAERDARGSRFLILLGLLAIAAVSVTHHLTSFALVLLLGVWTVADVAVSRRLRSVVVGSLVWSLLTNAVWLFLFAGPAVPYLSEIIGGGVAEIGRVLTGGEGGRTAFGGRVGADVPFAEIVVGYASVLLLLGLFALAVPHVLRRHRHDAFVLTLLAVAAAYPVSLALRLTRAGAETSQRASEFVFLGVGFVVADVLLHCIAPQPRPAAVTAEPGWRARLGERREALTGLVRKRLALIPMLVVVFAGGIVIGVPPVSRLPGPYQPAAEQRSVDRRARELATWTAAALAPGQRVIADRVNSKIVAAVGGHYPVTQYNSDVPTAYVMFPAELRAEELALLREGRIAYVITDRRLTEAPPRFAVFYEGAEPGASEHTGPFPAAGFDKFDRVPGVRRIYDDGAITVYDVRGLVSP
jgi:hypothetical protein